MKKCFSCGCKDSVMILDEEADCILCDWSVSIGEYNLLATAPDLLKACKKALTFLLDFVSEDGDFEVEEELKEVIKRAENKEGVE